MFEIVNLKSVVERTNNFSGDCLQMFYNKSTGEIRTHEHRRADNAFEYANTTEIELMLTTVPLTAEQIIQRVAFALYDYTYDYEPDYV